MTNEKFGDIGISTDKNTLSRLIRFFTRSKVSHTFLIQQPIGGNVVAQEAALVVQCVPFEAWYVNSPVREYVLYRPKNIEDAFIKEALDKSFIDYAGQQYGWLQCLWFSWRWFAGIFGIDVRKETNWYPDGVLCTEIIYDYLINLGPQFAVTMVGVNKDTVDAQDILTAFQMRPDLFELVEEKNLGIAT
jgi:hypothetical protein